MNIDKEGSKMSLMNKKLIVYIIYSITIFLVLLGFIFIAVNVAKELNGRIGFELNEVYSVDHILYFTVARGMMSGGKPYLDYYENKPPLIFVMCMISYLIRGDFYLLNVMSFISFIIIRRISDPRDPAFTRHKPGITKTA